MLADHDDRRAILDLINETYRRMSTPGSDPAALLAHPEFAAAGSGLGELAYDQSDVRAMAEAVASAAYTWSAENVTVWREGDVAWAQILGSVRTNHGGVDEAVPYWTTGVFAYAEDAWGWRYWGGAEPQSEPRV